MIKQSLPSAILLLVLGVLIAAYVLIVSDLRSEVYTPDEQLALVVHSRLNLSQAAPLWNTYYWDETLVAPTLGSTLGATEWRGIAPTGNRRIAASGGEALAGVRHLLG